MRCDGILSDRANVRRRNRQSRHMNHAAGDKAQLTPATYKGNYETPKCLLQAQGRAFDLKQTCLFAVLEVKQKLVTM